MTEQVTISRTDMIPRNCPNCGHNWSFQHTFNWSYYVGSLSDEEVKLNSAHSSIDNLSKSMRESPKEKFLCPKCKYPAQEIFNEGIGKGILKIIDTKNSFFNLLLNSKDDAILLGLWLCLPGAIALIYFWKKLLDIPAYVRWGLLSFLFIYAFYSCFQIIRFAFFHFTYSKYKDKISAWILSLSEKDTLT